MPDRLTFRLDTHYSVCEAGQCEPVGGASAAALFGLSPSASAAVLSDIPGALLSRLDGGAMPAFIPPGSLSAITDAELTMFEYLSTSTETSAFRAFIRDPEGPQFGVDHPLAGDVNNSNCVDRVDLGALMADGVYLHEAVPPNDAAIQADLDHDGWAGPGDRTLVLDNLGSNCPYPVCGDGEQEGLEQCDDGNVDDGDGCSTWCLAEVTSMATLQKWNDWGTGYCATLHITNDDSIATKKWTVVLNANNTDIYTLWNANTQYDGNVVTLKPLSWNARIQPGQTNSSVGFCAFRRTGDMESEAFVYSAIGY
jgi:cysteine-rich repeat protein